MIKVLEIREDFCSVLTRLQGEVCRSLASVRRHSSSSAAPRSGHPTRDTEVTAEAAAAAGMSKLSSEAATADTLWAWRQVRWRPPS